MINEQYNSIPVYYFKLWVLGFFWIFTKWNWIIYFYWILKHLLFLVVLYIDLFLSKNPFIYYWRQIVTLFVYVWSRNSDSINFSLLIATFRKIHPVGIEANWYSIQGMTLISHWSPIRKLFLDNNVNILREVVVSFAEICDRKKDKRVMHCYKLWTVAVRIFKQVGAGSIHPEPKDIGAAGLLMVT